MKIKLCVISLVCFLQAHSIYGMRQAVRTIARAAQVVGRTAGRVPDVSARPVRSARSFGVRRAVQAQQEMSDLAARFDAMNISSRVKEPELSPEVRAKRAEIMAEIKAAEAQLVFEPREKIVSKREENPKKYRDVQGFMLKLLMIKEFKHDMFRFLDPECLKYMYAILDEATIEHDNLFLLKLFEIVREQLLKIAPEILAKTHFKDISRTIGEEPADQDLLEVSRCLLNFFSEQNRKFFEINILD